MTNGNPSSRLDPSTTRKRGLAMFACAVLALPVGAFARPADDAALPRIGPAPDFNLVSQSGRQVSLRDLRGRVTVVTFIFAGCSDTCPVLTSKLAGIQRRLGARGDDVRFAAITVDPLNDTPAALAAYGRAHGVDPMRFLFLTGPVQEIDTVTRAYAVFRKQLPGNGIDHTFLTSLVDRQGVLRVQYIGVRFDPQEFLRDLTSLVNERGPP
jgi:protein SCO1/2